MCGSRGVDVRRNSLSGLVVVLAQRPVMVVVSVLDGRLVDGGLLQGGVRPTEPSQGRDGLGKDHEQRQHVSSQGPRLSGIEEEAFMERPS